MNDKRDTHDVTRALAACYQGDRQALEQVVSRLYDDLRLIARRQLRRSRPGETLDTTGLVHEAYLKLAGHERLDCHDREHFLAVVARAMRQIVVDYARKRQRDKRGGDLARVPLDDDLAATVQQSTEALLTLDAALARLAAIDDRLIRLVECRFFAGLTEEETAAALGISRRTVQRDWVRARAWLRVEIGALTGGDRHD
jgi:RNA polymerase sigma factor (TIGR02999 family)